MSGYILVTTSGSVPRVQLKTEAICRIVCFTGFHKSRQKSSSIHFLNVKAFEIMLQSAENELWKRDLLTLEMNKYSSSTWHLKVAFYRSYAMHWCKSTDMRTIKAFTVSFFYLSGAGNIKADKPVALRQTRWLIHVKRNTRLGSFFFT